MQLKTNKHNEWTPLEGDGDFRSEESIDLLSNLMWQLIRHLVYFESIKNSLSINQHQIHHHHVWLPPRVTYPHQRLVGSNRHCILTSSTNRNRSTSRSFASAVSTKPPFYIICTAINFWPDTFQPKCGQQPEASPVSPAARFCNNQTIHGCMIP